MERAVTELIEAYVEYLYALFGPVYVAELELCMLSEE